MKKIVIVCGLIAGFIVSAVMIAAMAAHYSGSGSVNENGMLIGYASMILAFSLIFAGVKSYRDNYQGGTISFGKAFKIGLCITLIASTMYVAVWLIDYYFFIPDFGDKYAAHMMEKLKAAGASQPEIDKRAIEMASFAKMYKNPVFNALITYSEIVPVGLLITILSAFILKRKTSLSAAQSIA